MTQLLIELFSEEIPARMQLGAARDLERLFDTKLKAQGIDYKSLKAYVSPRRLTLHAEGLPLEQAAVLEEVKGPKESAPPQALEGFLRKVGLTREQLVIENGVFIARIEKPAKKTADALPEILKDVILSFPWPKSMRSGTSTFRWVRPLKRITFLFDGQVLPFEIGGVSASNVTEGHRFLGSGEPFEVADFASYKKALKEHFVILDHLERQSIILDKAHEVTAAAGCSLIEDHGLLEEVAGLNEWPVPLLGDMDEKFLSLPPEVIRTSMRTHQKYFAVRDLASGKMAAKFVVVSNLKASDKGAEIKRGNAKVLSARLSDAVFFWSEDNRAGNFDAWNEKLKGVTFHAKLGTMAQRVERIVALAQKIAPVVRADVGMTGDAARISKADLASLMVGEFPELQGIMGGYYAEAAKLPRDISDAIRDHYKPQGPSDSLPEGAVSVAVALADKIDTLTAFFAIDEKPTGSKDPYALRRAALGVLRILREHNVRLSLNELLEVWYYSLLNYAGPKRAVYVDTDSWRGSAGPRWNHNGSTTYDNYLRDFRQGLLESPVYVLETDRDHDLDITFEHVENHTSVENALLTFRDYKTVSAEFNAFFADRLKVMLKDEGVRFDAIEAGFAIADTDILRIVARIRALETILATDAGENLQAGFTRVNNILSAEAKKGALPEGQPQALANTPEVEAELIRLLTVTQPAVQTFVAEENYEAALTALAGLRPAIDAFLDGVLVNAEEAGIRENRLKLLSSVRKLFGSVGDLSKLV
ncbi:MAG: glycine--tRNA ligase subunit beta [Asticcacaulis sp.]